MIRGTQVYGDIDARLRTTRKEVDAIARDLQATTTRLERLGMEESRDLGRLAKVRLEALEAKDVVRGLDAADEQVLRLLEQKQDALERAQREIEASEARQQSIESERVQTLARLDEARSRHGDLVVQALAKLETQEAYQFQRERVETISAQARRADEKAAQTEADREAKGRPYEENKLFAYLWKRQYGTPAYRAGNLVTALDGWVARLSRYDRARLDYAMLLEIPVRLREHADRLAAEADAELQALGELQREAFASAGVPRLADEVESLERALADIESSLEAEEKKHRALLEQRADLVGGEDRYTRQALEVLRANLEREPVSTLRADAARTSTPSDDTLVADIAAQRDEAKALQKEARRLRQRQAKVMAAMNDLEEVRRRYRRQNYDARDSTFRDGMDTGGLLDQLLKGGVVIGDVMNEMGRNHRFEVPRRRGRSGGGFTLPDFGGSSSRRSGGTSRPRAPRSRPRSSGGFRTGGGF